MITPNLTETENLFALERASEDVAKAMQQQIAILKLCYPIGAYIRWKYGPHVQAGRVVQHRDYAPSLWAVNGGTGKRVLVNTLAILEALKDTDK